MDKELTIQLARTLDLLERGIVLEEMALLTERELEIIEEYSLIYDPDACVFMMGNRMVDPARLTSIRDDIERDRDYSGADWLVEMRGAY